MDGGCTEPEVTAAGSPKAEAAQQGSNTRSINGKQGDDSEGSLEK